MTGFPGGAGGNEPTSQHKGCSFDLRVWKIPLEEGTVTHSSILP